MPRNTEQPHLPEEFPALPTGNCWKNVKGKDYSMIARALCAVYQRQVMELGRTSCLVSSATAVLI